MPTPIKLTIYNNEHEPVKELQTSLVPWGILKRAIRLSKSMNLGSEDPKTLMETLDEAGFDNLTGLVQDVFHGQVTLEELTWGTETIEMIAVLQAIISRAFAEFGDAGGDPTQRG